MDRLLLVGQATGNEPAAGAAVGEALGATAGALVATAAISLLIAGHRRGRIGVLAGLSRFAERASGLPSWAALPSTVLGASLLTATILITPPDAADGAHFFNVTAWQGGGRVVDKLEKIGPGLYRTTEPIPVHGGWKAMIRLHRGDALVAVPIYLPRDRAIPAAELPAKPSFTARSFATSGCSSASARPVCRARSRCWPIPPWPPSPRR